MCAHLLATEGVLAPRRILGVLALARKHGPAITEDAALKQIDPLIRQLTDSRDLIARRAAAS